MSTCHCCTCKPQTQPCDVASDLRAEVQRLRGALAEIYGLTSGAFIPFARLVEFQQESIHAVIDRVLHAESGHRPASVDEAQAAQAE